ncbi:hypothetical protein TruAng_000706 [Truncatella angustata]|nr:hypothetical protein TruAng_000706 [Truncatella angustata]
MQQPNYGATKPSSDTHQLNQKHIMDMYHDNSEADNQPLIQKPHDDENQPSTYNSDMIRDIIIGFADGLTVPFALTAGLSSLGSTKLVVMGGLAELFSGCISMGLGAYLAASTEAESYAHRRDEFLGAYSSDEERRKCKKERVYGVLTERYQISREAARPLVEELVANDCCQPSKEKDSVSSPWVRFVMDTELKLEAPDVNRAWISALTMGLSYFIGGLIPMIPYFLMEKATEALIISIAITVVILLVFGYIKNWVMIRNKRAGLRGALQTLVIGALAAGTSYVIVRALD